MVIPSIMDYVKFVGGMQFSLICSDFRGAYREKYGGRIRTSWYSVTQNKEMLEWLDQNPLISKDFHYFNVHDAALLCQGSGGSRTTSFLRIICARAAVIGNEELFGRLLNDMSDYNISNDMLREAAYSGSIDGIKRVIEMIHKRGLTVQYSYWHSLLSVVICEGYLSVTQWLLHSDRMNDIFNLIPGWIRQLPSGYYITKCIVGALKKSSRHLETIKYLLLSGIDRDPLMKVDLILKERNFLDIVPWLLEHGIITNDNIRSQYDIIEIQARRCNTEGVLWLRTADMYNERVPWQRDICLRILYYDPYESPDTRVSMIKWFLHPDREVDCGGRPSVNPKCAELLITMQRLDVLQWILNALPEPFVTSLEIVRFAIANNEVHAFHWAIDNFFPQFLGQVRKSPEELNDLFKLSMKSSLEITRWLYALAEQCGIPLSWNEGLYVSATSSHVEWLWLYKCPGDSDACSSAAMRGDIELVRWLRHDDREKEGGRCPWDVKTCVNAAKNGDIELLKWLRHDDREKEGGRCPWNASVCEAAVLWIIDSPIRSTLEVVEWLRDPDRESDAGGRCPWNESVCEAAVQEDKMDVLKWMRSESRRHDGGGRCPWDTGTIDCAIQMIIQKGDDSYLRWLRDEERNNDAGGQCPWTNTQSDWVDCLLNG